MVSVNKIQPNKPLTPNKTKATQTNNAWDLTDYIQLLIYGRSGTGKTTLWSTFPGPTLALICSGGMLSGELRSIRTPENMKKIKAVRIESVEQVGQLIDEAKQTGTYKTVVVDHISGLQDLVLKEILGLDEVPLAKYKTAGKGESWGLASKQQWGQCIIRCKEIIRSIISVRANIVMVAHEKEFKPEESEDDLHILPSVGAELSPKLSNWLGGAVDYVVNTFIRTKMGTKTIKTPTNKTKQIPIRTEEVEYCIRTGADPIYNTKFREPSKGKNLPKLIVNPNYEIIVQCANGLPIERTS